MNQYHSIVTKDGPTSILFLLSFYKCACTVLNILAKYIKGCPRQLLELAILK